MGKTHDKNEKIKLISKWGSIGWFAAIILLVGVVMLYVGTQAVPKCSQEIKYIEKDVNVYQDVNQFTCPGDMNNTLLTQCKEYGKQFIPADQKPENIIKDYPDASCQKDQTSGLIFCMDCTKDQNIGWMCTRQ